MIKTFYRVPAIYDTQIEKLNGMAFPELDTEEAEDIEVMNALRRDKICRLLFVNDDNLVVGKISLYKRTVFYDKLKIELGGIGGVATHPDFRNQGVASSLLNRAMAVLKEKSCDIAFLCTDTSSSWKVKMYENFGFKLLPYGYTFLGNGGLSVSRNDGLVAPIKSLLACEKVLESKSPLFIGQGVW